jgi:hypothetical protein
MSSVNDAGQMQVKLSSHFASLPLYVFVRIPFAARLNVERSLYVDFPRRIVRVNRTVYSAGVGFS